MITKAESENLFILIAKYGDSKVSGDKLAINHHGQKLADYIDSLTEKTEVKPKVYYGVNLNPVGYLPESEPYEGLETIEEILSAIFDCIYWFDYDEYDKNCAEFPTRKEIEDGLKLAIETNTLEHETIGYIDNDNYCIFVYKDHEYEYRQSK